MSLNFKDNKYLHILGKYLILIITFKYFFYKKKKKSWCNWFKSWFKYRK